MTDRELLELAAKAAGFDPLRFTDEGEYPTQGLLLYGVQDPWNPLESDGDAFRLLVWISNLDGGTALLINSRFGQHGFAQVTTNERVIAPQEWLGDNARASTRRAIVRAAAEIGKSMQ